MTGTHKDTTNTWHRAIAVTGGTVAGSGGGPSTSASSTDASS
ncbi:hypothetical protein AB0H69_07245 [Streptomyces phaeochromogenes]